MSRLRADLLLLVATLIWGTTFIAQKTGMEGLGPFGFAGFRFALSFIVILPFALRERKKPVASAPLNPLWFLALSAAFTAGVILQQIGILYTSVTNAGFLTGLYVVAVPFIGWLFFRQRPSVFILPACALAVLGTFFLNGASLTRLGYGDAMVMLCALGFAVQMVITGYIVQRTSRPFMLSALQYGACAAVGLALMAAFETITVATLLENAPQLLYAGLLSGGVAFTLQAIAQQYTPASDAAVIMAGEALWAALAAIVILGESLPWKGALGCALILAALLLVEGRALLTQGPLRKIRRAEGEA